MLRFASGATFVIAFVAACQSGETKPAVVPAETLQGSVSGDPNTYLRRLPSRVHFVDERRGLIETVEGRVLETSDSGIRWRRSTKALPPGPRAAGGRRLSFGGEWVPRSISRPGPRRIYAVLWHLGLARSDDGGRHWRQVYPPRPGPPAGPLSFSSTRSGIGARSEGLRPDGAVIVATTDGGRTWRPRSRIRGYHIRQLERVSARSVWAAAARRMRNGGGYSRTRLFRSDDDGRTWRPVSAPPLGFGTLSVVDGHVAFLYGESGTLRTDDGGASWSRRGRDPMYGAGFLDRDRGYGTRGDDRLLATSDGGKTWQPVTLPGGFRVLDVSVDPPNRIWLTGNGRMLRSEDGGRRWTQIGFGGAAPPYPAQWVSGRLGVVPYGIGGHYRTVDGGRTWRFVAAR